MMWRHLNYGKLCAIAMIALSVGAATGYFFQRDYRRTVYWLCSAGLIAAVTF